MTSFLLHILIACCWYIEKHFLNTLQVTISLKDLNSDLYIDSFVFSMYKKKTYLLQMMTP